MKYQIVSGEDRADAATIGEAKVMAGEWQLERDRIVIIERTKAPRRRWKATLTESFDVRLDPLPIDPHDSPRTRPNAKPWELAHPGDVIHHDNPDAERARLVEHYAKQWSEIEATYGAQLDTRKRLKPIAAEKRKPRKSRDGGLWQTARKVYRLDAIGNPVGDPFPSIKEAARAAGIAQSSMQRRIKDRNGYGIVFVGAGGNRVEVAS